MQEEKKAIEINWNTRIRTNPNFVLRQIAGEYTLVPVGDAGRFENMTLTMNESSAFIWNIFAEGATISEVRDRILEEYTFESENNADILSSIMEYVIQNVVMGLLIPEEQTE